MMTYPKFGNSVLRSTPGDVATWNVPSSSTNSVTNGNITTGSYDHHSLCSGYQAVSVQASCASKINLMDVSAIETIILPRSSSMAFATYNGITAVSHPVPIPSIPSYTSRGTAKTAFPIRKLSIFLVSFYISILLL
ncbi:hypothetical protein E8E15_001249 [Penicillium rubens]|nr:hypothetical protein E8E15_001249 [Penicillium rubens]